MPSLRAVKPEEVTKYLKLLAFGGAGTWKTTNFTQIPKTYFLDLERGAEYPEYVQHLSTGGSVVFPTTDIDEVITEVTSLMSERHDFRNIVIDPITTVFNDEADIQEQYVGSEYGKNTAAANKKWRRLAKLLKRVNMNVFVSAYEKAEFGSDPRVWVPNGPKDIAHFFDVVLRAEKRGNEVVAHVVKSRSKTFPDGAVIPFTYAEIAARASDELARESVPIALASADQVAELTRLLSIRVDGDQLRDKALKKYSAEEISELPADAATKFVAYLKSGNPAETTKTEAA